MRRYDVTIEGKSPLLMHWDNIAWSEKLKRWREIPENKKLSVAGDDRSPAFGWIGSLYNDGVSVAIPSDNIMRCLMEGGASVLVPGGKSGKTFKAQTQSGMLVHEEFWPLLIGDVTVPVSLFEALGTELSFEKHEQTAIAHGFVLFTKRAKIGMSKHVRVRLGTMSWRLFLRPRSSFRESIGKRHKGLEDWRDLARRGSARLGAARRGKDGPGR